MTNSPGPLLRPLGVGEQLDAGFRHWRPRFGRLYLLSAILTVPFAVIGFIYDATAIVEIASSGVVFVEDVDSFERTSGLIAIARVAAAYLATAALFATISRTYIGEADEPIGQVLRQTLRRILPFVGMSILVGLASMVGFLALIVPGIILAVSLSLAFPMFWAEGTPAVESIRRSWRLIRGRRWQVFGLALVTGIFSYILNIALVAAGFAFLLGSEVVLYAFVVNVVATLWTAAIVPLIPIMVTVAYYDCRVRNEGFDLELAGQQLDDSQNSPNQDSSFE